MNLESSFCAMIKVHYDFLMTSLEMALLTPMKVLDILNAMIATVKNVVFATVETMLTSIEIMFNKLFSAETLGLEDTQKNLCRVLYECAILTDYLFESDKSPLKKIFSDTQINDIKNNFSTFESYVCHGKLEDLVAGFKNQLLNDFLEQIEMIENMIRDKMEILEGWVEKYKQALEDSGIYDILDKLGKIMNCALTGCDALSSGANKLEDTADRLKVTMGANGFWTFDSQVLNKLNEMNYQYERRLNEIKWRITQKQNNKGIVRPDEVM